MRKPITILIILPLFVLFSGCKNSKESNETPDKDWNIKNSKLFDYHWYNPSKKEYVIKYSEDLAFLDDLSQEEIEEYIENLLCFIDITEPNFFERFSHIKSLTYIMGRLDNLEPLTYLHNIERLSISGENIVNISPLADIKNLEELSITNCNGITDISPIINLKNLKSLYLYDCNGIKDISSIGNLKDLDKLVIINCNNIKDVNFIFDLSNLKTLYLNLENMPDLTQLKKLENLEYFGSKAALDRELLDILLNLKHLQKVTAHYAAVKDDRLLFKLPDFTEIDYLWDMDKEIYNEEIYNRETVKKRLDAGEDPNERRNSGALTRSDAINPYFLYGEITPLMWSRKPETTELLIKYGARVNDQDEYGRTALMISACFDGYNEKDNLNARILMKNGADLNIKNNRGQTALYIAIISENDASIKLLVDNGADVNLRDNRGVSPLMAAKIIHSKISGVESEIPEELEKILVKAGAVMNDDDRQKAFRLKERRYEDFTMKEILYMTGGDDCR
jgi:ankyrin repeat protein